MTTPAQDAGVRRVEEIAAGLTKAQRAILRYNEFRGFPAGSNFWPLVCFRDPRDGTPLCDGEEVDRLLRLGLFRVDPTDGAHEVGEHREVGMIEARCRLTVTPLGQQVRAHLALSNRAPDAAGVRT